MLRPDLPEELIDWEADDEFDNLLEDIDKFDLWTFPVPQWRPTPRIRARLHVICALYAAAGSLKLKMRLLDRMEAMTLYIAAALAADMLNAGWRPLKPEDSKARDAA